MVTDPMPPRALLARLLGAATGVIAIHQVAYLVAHPSGVGRALATEGHGYLAPAAATILPLAATVAMWAIVCRLAARTAPGRTTPLARTGDYVVLFVLQELLERVADGQPVTAVLAEPAVWLGLGLAPVLAWAARGIVRSIDRAALIPAAPVPAARRTVLGVVVLAAPVLRFESARREVWRVRGPPALRS